MAHIDEGLRKDLFDLCIDRSRERFETFSKIKNCASVEIEKEKIIDSVNHRSEILLYGLSITVRLQFFYDYELLKKHLEHLFQVTEKSNIIDFFNEVANLSGGKIKEIFVEQGIVSALSLPMNISTAKAKICSVVDVLPHSMYIAVQTADAKRLYDTRISFEVHDPTSFKGFDKNFKKSDIDDGDVEFF